MTTTTRIVRNYKDDSRLGEVDLTAEQFAHYKAMSQQPEGLIRLGSLPYYNLDAEKQDTHEDTTVYLD